MKHSEIIIIGSSFAGISCALMAKQLYPNKHILLIEKESTIGHIPSSLNMLLKQQINELSEKTFINEDTLKESGVELLLNKEVTDIHSMAKTLSVKSGTIEEIYQYDRLILAMGSSSASERISGSNHKQVLTTKTLEASINTLKKVEKSERILIAGGGQIGLEAAEALTKANKKVTLVEAFDSLAFKYFDSDMTQQLEERMLQSGIELHKGRYVKNIQPFEGQLKVGLSQDLELITDNVMLAVNFRPNTRLVESFVECHLDKTIIVDPYLETSQPDVFAVGDLIRVPYAYTESDYYLPFVNNAYISGKVAAINLYRKTTPAPQSLRVVGSQLFGLYMTSVGLTEQEAMLYYPIQTTFLEQSFSTEASAKVSIKIMTKKETGQLVGAQIYSDRDILSLADLLAISINTQMTDEALAFQDRLYYDGKFSVNACLYEVALKSYQKRLKEVMLDVT